MNYLNEIFSKETSIQMKENQASISMGPLIVPSIFGLLTVARNLFSLDGPVEISPLVPGKQQ